MNWINNLLMHSADRCQHYIYCNYKIAAIPSPLIDIDNDKKLISYPISPIQKIKHKLSLSHKKKKLLQFIRKEKIQCIHVHFGNMGIEYFDILKEVPIPKFISLYGFDYEYLPNNYPDIKSSYYDMSRCGVKFIVEGRFSLQILESYGIETKDIGLIHLSPAKCGVYKLNPWSTPIRLIQVATYTPKKGQETLLNALTRFNRNIFKVDLYGEMGDSLYYQSLVEIISKNNLHNVRLYGKIGKEEYQKKLNGAHIAVNLSRKTDRMDTEGGVPVFIKEALLCGKPVLSTFHCDIPETVIHNFTGWLINENNVDECYLTLCKIQNLTYKEYQKYSGLAYISMESNANKSLGSMELVDLYVESLP